MKTSLHSRRFFKALFGLALIAFLASCATPSSVGPLAVPLSYQTMASPGDFSTLPPCASIADVQAIDARADKTLGKRFINDNAATVAPVTAASDVAGWVRAGALETLKRSGVSLGKAGAPTLQIAVEQIRTNENVVHRSGYDGKIVISARLSRAPGGAVCWKDRAEGAAENYGYTGSIQNYQETLNHCLDRAMIRLVALPGFGHAACSCGGNR